MGIFLGVVLFHGSPGLEHCWSQDKVWRSCLQGSSLSRKHFHIVWREEVMQRLVEPGHLGGIEGENNTY